MLRAKWIWEFSPLLLGCLLLGHLGDQRAVGSLPVCFLPQVNKLRLRVHEDLGGSSMSCLCKYDQILNLLFVILLI